MLCCCSADRCNPESDMISQYSVYSMPPSHSSLLLFARKCVVFFIITFLKLKFKNFNSRLVALVPTARLTAEVRTIIIKWFKRSWLNESKYQSNSHYGSQHSSMTSLAFQVVFCCFYFSAASVRVSNASMTYVVRSGRAGLWCFQACLFQCVQCADSFHEGRHSPVRTVLFTIDNIPLLWRKYAEKRTAVN